jgi:hypothetical protein
MLQAQARVFYLFELNQKTNLGILNHIVEKKWNIESLEEIY